MKKTKRDYDSVYYMNKIELYEKNFACIAKSCIFALAFRGVAQLASALAWGARGRKFESSRPDKVQKKEQRNLLFFYSSGTQSMNIETFNLESHA